MIEHAVRLGRRRLNGRTVVALSIWTALFLPHLALGQYCLYMVNEGDSGPVIAAAQSCELAELAASNPTVDWGALEMGQYIILPDTCECPAPQRCTVTVEKRDTAYEIATSRGCYVKDLQDANPGLDLSELEVGWRLRVPTDRCRCSPNVAACTYTVTAGDTLFKLAAALHCPWTAVLSFTALNPALDPEFLLVDQQLIIPPTCNCPDGAIDERPSPTSVMPSAPVASTGSGADAPPIASSNDPTPCKADALVDARPAEINDASSTDDATAQQCSCGDFELTAILAAVLGSALLLIAGAVIGFVLWRRCRPTFHEGAMHAGSASKALASTSEMLQDGAGPVTGMVVVSENPVHDNPAPTTTPIAPPVAAEQISFGSDSEDSASEIEMVTAGGNPLINVCSVPATPRRTNSAGYVDPTMLRRAPNEATTRTIVR